MSSRVLGRSIAHNAGTPTIAPGNNVAATTATASPTTDSVDTLDQTTDSASTGCPSRFLADIPASSTRAIGSVSLIRGQNTGATTGTTTTTFTSLTLTTAITCTTAGTPTSELRSTSRCDGCYPVQPRERLHQMVNVPV